MKVKIRDIQIGEKTLELEKGEVEEIISKLDLTNNGVILVRNGDILTKDDKINDGDVIELIEVYSGG
ncbi:MAG: MoaD/ThiS family protein [Candidatus Rehaiarchaeum fermentans]|nr:MoaD/ThiS family protein [Candidatus Rehaiarchaeum fermentans]MCW1297055.1 MoaD/ThiS family protein [Candidatus Rehaiarchaeum fermentans]MCW1302425.1 MoaD/ThiS family protein [Candidatus Rehaiarchaeum fermentans]